MTPKQNEPVAWKWHQAPVKTSWGDGMVVADLAIDKDHTVSIYCEHDQTAKVEAMFTQPHQEAKDETAQQRMNKLPPNDSFERDEAARNKVREFMRNH